jgi:hypothetical protein
MRRMQAEKLYDTEEQAKYAGKAGVKEVLPV